MIEIVLTNGMVTIIDDCDAHLAAYSWHFQEYPKIGIKCHDGKWRHVALHHAVIGRPLHRMEVDHINGNVLDNRRCNLRIVTRRENAANRKEHRGEKLVTSRYVGVSLQRCRVKEKTYLYWKAIIFNNGKNNSLGSFKTEQDASNAYQKALKSIKEKETVNV